MILKNIKANKDRGFTIVELLVVIVVIGILAAITIVSYTGITARANAAATKQMASNIISKAGIYQTEGSTLNWPVTGALAISATNSSAAINATPSATTVALAAASMTTFSYQLCGTTSTLGGTVGTPIAAPAAPYTNITNPTGVIVGYWDYGKTTPGESTLPTGQTSGTAIVPNSTSVNTIACIYTGA